MADMIMDREEIKNNLAAVLNNAQHLHRHGKALKQIHDVYRSSSKDEFNDLFGAYVYFVLQQDPKSPYTRHVSDFFAKFLNQIHNDHNAEAEKRFEEMQKRQAEREKEEQQKGGKKGQSKRSKSASNRRRAAAAADENDEDEENEDIFDQIYGNAARGEDSESEEESGDSQPAASRGGGRGSKSSKKPTKSKSKSGRTPLSNANNVNNGVEQEQEPLSLLEDTMLELITIMDENCDVSIRLNACRLFSNIMSTVNDINLDVFNQAKGKLIPLTKDVKHKVRASVMKALKRFQDTDQPQRCDVRSVLAYHITRDPEGEVREEALQSILPQPDTSSLEAVLRATRDKKDSIRKLAYTKLGHVVKMLDISLNERLNVLRDGLHERSSTCRRVVCNKLIPQWLREMETSSPMDPTTHVLETPLERFLTALDVVLDDTKFTAELLNEIFKTMLDEFTPQEERNKFPGLDLRTRFHVEAKRFADTYLDGDRLLKEFRTPERVFLWRQFMLFTIKNEDKINGTENMAGKEQQEEDNYLQEFLANSQDQAANLLDGGEIPTVEGGIPGTTQTTPRERELIDFLKPDLPLLCHLILDVADESTRISETDATNLFPSSADEQEAQELKDEQIMNLEFIFNQILEIMLESEAKDDAEIKALSETLHDLAMRNQLAFCFENHLESIMKLYSLVVCRGRGDRLMDVLLEMIDEVKASLYQKPGKNSKPTDKASDQVPTIAINREPQSDPQDNVDKVGSKSPKPIPTPPPPPVPRMTEAEVERKRNELKNKYSELTIKYNDLIDERDEACERREYNRAAAVQEQMDVVNGERAEVKGRLDQLKFVDEQPMEVQTVIAEPADVDDAQSESQATQQSQATDKEVSTERHADGVPSYEEMAQLLKDNPLQLNMIINMVHGALKYGGFREVNATIQMLIDNVIISGVMSKDWHNRASAMRALGVCCILSQHCLIKYQDLFKQAIEGDSEDVPLEALKALMDGLVAHGLSVLYLDSEGNPLAAELLESESSGSEAGGSQSSILADAAAESDPVKKMEQKVMNRFQDFLCDRLEDSRDDIRFVAAEGVVKLMIHNRMHSPFLLAKLIILYFHPSSEEELQNMLGITIPYYTGINDHHGRFGKSAQRALHDSFFDALETVYLGTNTKENATLEEVCYWSHIDMKSMAKFMIIQMNRKTQAGIALPILSKMADLGPEDELAKVYLTCLTLLDFYDCSLDELRSIEDQLTAFEKRTKRLIGPLKVIYKRLHTTIADCKERIKNDLSMTLDETMVADDEPDPAADQPREPDQQQQNSRSNSGDEDLDATMINGKDGEDVPEEENKENTPAASVPRSGSGNATLTTSTPHRSTPTRQSLLNVTARLLPVGIGEEIEEEEEEETRDTESTATSQNEGSDSEDESDEDREEEDEDGDEQDVDMASEN